MHEKHLVRQLALCVVVGAWTVAGSAVPHRCARLCAARGRAENRTRAVAHEGCTGHAAALARRTAQTAADTDTKLGTLKKIRHRKVPPPHRLSLELGAAREVEAFDLRRRQD